MGVSWDAERKQHGRKLAPKVSRARIKTRKALSCALIAESTASNLVGSVFAGWTTNKVCASPATAEDKATCASNSIGMANLVPVLVSRAAGLATACPERKSDAAFCTVVISDLTQLITSYGAQGATIN